MGKKTNKLPTPVEIQELISYLPKLYAEGFSPFKQWHGGNHSDDGVFQAAWPEYEPIVVEFFNTLAQECWSDYNYTRSDLRNRIKDEAFIRSADLSQIKTMLTICTRAERFIDGAWGTVIDEGIIRSLLERLDEIRGEMKG